MEDLFHLFYSSSGVCTDTRKIKADCLFICLSGTNFNGNMFAEQALELGAKYVIVDDPNCKTKEHIYQVENSLVFLQKLANQHREKFSIPVVGITGSNGKTSTKELIHTVLSKKFNTLATVGNLNNHIGVPLTLLDLNETNEIAIIEMGANKFKDIEELCEIAKPTHGIITNIGKAHLEGFINFEGVLKTKKELYHAVSEVSGTIIYNADDEILRSILPENTTNLKYGTHGKTELIGELIDLNPYVVLKWSYGNHHSEAITTNMIGKYNFYNFLAAITFGIHFGVDPIDISDAIRDYIPNNNRSELRKTERNTLIMDAYNANPTSMRSALESFAAQKQLEKLVILGDMFELGTESQAEHEQIIRLIEKLELKAYLIGSHFYQNKKSINNCVQFFEKKSDFEYFLKNQPIENQLILLKGSRGIGLEEIVQNL